MPARRRFPGSESDENFSVLIDSGDSPIGSQQQNSNSNLIEDPYTGDEKKKYATTNSSFYGVSGFSVPTGLTKWSTNIGSFLQQQIVQAQNVNVEQIFFENKKNDVPVPAAAFDDTGEDSIFDDCEEKVDEIVVMACRDRTGEFVNAIRSMQGRNIARAVNVRDPRKATQLQSYSEFMMIAKHIGKNIASTYSKLEKLTLRKWFDHWFGRFADLIMSLSFAVAKRKSLFDDRPAEIQELTYIIKGDLNSLNQQIARLQELSKSQRKATNAKHLLSHSSNMVLALQAKLANMSTDFKQVLEVRTENLKHQKTRRDQVISHNPSSSSKCIARNPILNLTLLFCHFQFSQGTISGNLPPPSMRGTQQGSLLLTEQDQVSIDINASTPLLAGEQRQQQQLMLYDESDNYVQQRAETMQNIESTIVELGGIFQQLAHMVKEQDEMVERIDSNVQDAELNIEAAHGEILKYFQTVTKNRWLMIKIFGVLIFFFIFFIIFMA